MVSGQFHILVVYCRRRGPGYLLGRCRRAALGRPDTVWKKHSSLPGMETRQFSTSLCWMSQARLRHVIKRNFSICRKYIALAIS